MQQLINAHTHRKVRERERKNRQDTPVAQMAALEPLRREEYEK
jgi:hypothetical protein